MNIRTLFVKYINLRNKLDQAKIYKIIDNTNGKIYIGSTCKTLKHRLSGHERDYKRFLKGIYNNVSSFDIIKNDDYKIELIENCDIKTKQKFKELRILIFQEVSFNQSFLPKMNAKLSTELTLKYISGIFLTFFSMKNTSLKEGNLLLSFFENFNF